ncbi:hypothetical protein AYI69_g8426, partial [Smittium culicis]
MTIHSLRHW